MYLDSQKRRTNFYFCVDDFRVKYFNKSDADQLLSSLQQNYECTIDWSRKIHFGLTIAWSYNKGYVDVSIPKYIPEILTRFKHKQPPKP